MRQFLNLTSFFCVALIFALLPLQAEKVDAGKAGSLAQRYVQSKRGLPEGDLVRLKHTATQKLKMNLTASVRDAVQTHAQDTAFYYVFNVSEAAGGGFVIVAGDDAVTPVLGYSDSGSYDENNLPPNFVYWMNYLQDEIRWAITQKLPQNETVRQQWDDYLNGNIIPTAVSPLLRTTWSQGAPYNNLCPIYSGSNRSVTGCVATAIAQIMKYHQHPAKPTGTSPAYTTSTNKISLPALNLSTASNYDWANMINSYTGTATTQQNSAVATLMYHCGHSVKMDYGASSGAYSFNAAIALATYFGYDKGLQMRKRQYYDNTSWDNILKGQIDAGLPVYYAGDGSSGGHAFVCDGYDNSGKFHFNWGWGGSYDGYFVSSTLNPGGYSFNNGQELIINIKPNANGPSTYIVGMTKLSANPVSVSLNQQFTISAEINNVGHNPIPAGTYGAALVNDKDEIVETFSFFDGAELRVGYYYPLNNYSCKLQTATPGKYKLRAAFKPAGGQWATVISSPNSIDFTVAGTTVPVTGVSLNKTSSSVNVGSTEQLTATVAPSNATNKSVTWSSSNTSVATVSSNGLVTGVAAGTSTITVTTVDGAKQATCLITVVRAGLSNNANLSALTVNQSSLSPSFNANTVSYTVNVANSVTSITVSATPADANATVTGTGSHQLIVGNNPINVVVTAQDGNTKKTYTVTVVRAGLSNNANLSALTVNQSSLSPTFNANTVSYTVNVTNSVTSITVSATPADVNATVTGTGSHPLIVGDNQINVVVTAQDGTTKKTYTITVFRPGINNNANLSALSVNQGSLSPAFNANTTDYTVEVANSVTSITVSATPADANATVAGTGNRTLNEGNNTIFVVVTAQDGITQKTYTITVIRPGLSNNANLSALSVNQGTLSPAFNANTVNYTVNVANSVASITVSATPADANATVAGTGNRTLNEGNNTIFVVVTAQDGITQKTYTITVVRPSLSNNAYLGSLTVNFGTLVPSFNPEITDYTVNVNNSVSVITITAEPAEGDAVISGNGQRSLKAGNNIFKIEVTAPSGTITKTYTVVVVREQVTNVEDNQEEPLKVYPNPAQDNITISGLQGNGILTVIDMAGRQLIRHQIVSPQETLSVSHLLQGFYIVEVVEGGNIRTTKILVE